MDEPIFVLQVMPEKREVKEENSWICYACRAVVKNFIVEDRRLVRDTVQPCIVMPDDSISYLRDVMGFIEATRPIVDNCAHDYYLRRWCQQWRQHNARIDRISAMVDNRLVDIDDCLEEWERISQEYEEAGEDGEKRRKMLWRVLEYKITYRDILYRDGPMPPEIFKRHLDMTKMHRDYIAYQLPVIIKTVAGLSPAPQDRILQIIKLKADQFEASGEQLTPDQLTVVKFYNDLVTACDEAKAKIELLTKGPEGTTERPLTPDTHLAICLERENPNKLLVPPGVRVVSDAYVSLNCRASDESAVTTNTETMFVDLVCLLELFEAMKSVPITLVDRPLTLPTLSFATAAAVTATSSTRLTDTDEIRNKISNIDIQLNKFEHCRTKMNESKKKIVKIISEIIDVKHDSRVAVSDSDSDYN